MIFRIHMQFKNKVTEWHGYYVAFYITKEVKYVNLSLPKQQQQTTNQTKNCGNKNPIQIEIVTSSWSWVSRHNVKCL